MFYRMLAAIYAALAMVIILAAHDAWIAGSAWWMWHEAFAILFCNSFFDYHHRSKGI